MNTIPVIDYATHPAFAPFASGKSDDGRILEEMHAIDELNDRPPNAANFIRDSARHWNGIKQVLDETVNDETLRERSKLVIDTTAETMAAKVSWEGKKKQRQCRSDDSRALLQQMKEHGAAVLSIPDDLREQLFDLFAEERATTEKRHAMNPVDRCVYHMNRRGPAYDLTLKALGKNGLIDAVSCLFGRTVQPVYWYLAHNSATESWYKGCYSDAGVPTSPFAYSHFDNDFDLAKIQIYLSDVTKENGPFAFVPGSHKWKGCHTQQFVFKGMDRMFKYPKNDAFYYRPRFGSEEYRREFMQLPTAMQGSSHMGDDVLEGTAMAGRLHAGFRHVTSDQGNCCVFSGGDLLHFGGLVQGADRWVLQLGLAAERPHSAGPAPHRSLLRRLLSRGRRIVGDKPINALGSIFGYTGDAEPAQNEYKPNA